MSWPTKIRNLGGFIGL